MPLEASAGGAVVFVAEPEQEPDPNALLVASTLSATSADAEVWRAGAGDGVLPPTLGDEENMLLPPSAGSTAWLVWVVWTWSLAPPPLLVVGVAEDVALATLAVFVPPAVGVCCALLVLAVDVWAPATPLVVVLVLPPLLLVLVLPAVVVERMGVRMAWMWMSMLPVDTGEDMRAGVATS